MDQLKIGKFIAEMRKKKGYTQKELAEQLGITDKAVSKWECGKSMPDNSIMILLCELLDINVNELLSGESLSSSEYNQKAEENMMSLIRETTENNQKSRHSCITIVVGEVSLLLLVVFMAVMSGGITRFTDFFDILSILVILAMDFSVLFMLGLFKPFFKAFPYCIKIDESTSISDVTKSYHAVKTTMLMSLISAFLMFIISIIIILRTLSTVEVLGVNLSVACLALLYGLIINAILLPVLIKLKMVKESFTA
ncbi:MAG: helix-turn-helix domain-containing protein [Roseburia sp.]